MSLFFVNTHNKTQGTMSMTERELQNEPHSYKFGQLPANVRHADISAGAKVLYAEISGMAIQGGYCYASNKYLAHLYDVDESTVIRWLKELSHIGVIDPTYDQTREVHPRRIYLAGYNPNK